MVHVGKNYRAAVTSREAGLKTRAWTLTGHDMRPANPVADIIGLRRVPARLGTSQSSRSGGASASCPKARRGEAREICGRRGRWLRASSARLTS